MPRRRTETLPVPVLPSNSLVASATRYPGKAARVYIAKQEWQRECYRHYAICGEARFAARFFGHAVSRAVLSAATIEAGKQTALTSGPAVDALAELFNGADGQTQMLELIGVHFAIAGECYLVGRHPEKADDLVDPQAVIWEIVSVIEMEVTGDQWAINYGDNRQRINLTESDVVIRLWLPAPEHRLRADSPFRSLLPLLNEIEWLTRHIFAQVQSRLAGAGILIMPQEMEFPPPPAVDGKEQDPNTANSFMLTLADGMLKPIDEPDSPAALVPLVITAPGDQIDKPRLMQFWSALDAEAKVLRDEAIRRFALGMDLPPEQVLGMGSNRGSGGGTSNGISHWGAWQIEESTIKLHVEPMLDAIANGLTVAYLRPLIDDPYACIIYDTSALRLRPDRSKEALELYDRGLISGAAAVRENGFAVEDMPDETEFQRWLTIKIATGSATPDQVAAALGIFGVHVPSGVGQTPAQLPDTPSLLDHPQRDIPDAALLAAADALVFRALERAGNRLRQNGQRPPGVPAYETHLYVRGTRAVLEDAWSCAPQVLAGIAVPEKVLPVLDSYCENLLTEQTKHTRDRLAEWLVMADVL